MLAAGLTILFGLILIGSSSAFNALISASVVALGVSYAIPIAINVCRGRKMLPPRAFTLPTAVGWAANLIGLAYTIVTTILFLFPPELPVTTTNMSKYTSMPLEYGKLIILDYCVVAFGIILFISTFQWIIDGRKNFTGPRSDMGLEVLEAMRTRETGSPEIRHVKIAGEDHELYEEK
jgi:choline transport protein